jgi:hypothetical protein
MIHWRGPLAVSHRAALRACGVGADARRTAALGQRLGSADFHRRLSDRRAGDPHQRGARHRRRLPTSDLAVGAGDDERVGVSDPACWCPVYRPPRWRVGGSTGDQGAVGQRAEYRCHQPGVFQRQMTEVDIERVLPTMTGQRSAVQKSSVRSAYCPPALTATDSAAMPGSFTATDLSGEHAVASSK